MTTPQPQPEPREPKRTPCEGCHGLGGNWDCDGENDPDICECVGCTGNEDCPECDGEGYY